MARISLPAIRPEETRASSPYLERAGFSLSLGPLHFCFPSAPTIRPTLPFDAKTL